MRREPGSYTHKKHGGGRALRRWAGSRGARGASRDHAAVSRNPHTGQVGGVSRATNFVRQRKHSQTTGTVRSGGTSRAESVPLLLTSMSACIQSPRGSACPNGARGAPAELRSRVQLGPRWGPLPHRHGLHAAPTRQPARRASLGAANDRRGQAGDRGGDAQGFPVSKLRASDAAPNAARCGRARFCGGAVPVRPRRVQSRARVAGFGASC